MRKVMKRNVAAVVLVVSAAFAGSAFGFCPDKVTTNTADGIMYCTRISGDEGKLNCTYSCIVKHDALQ